MDQKDGIPLGIVTEGINGVQESWWFFGESDDIKADITDDPLSIVWGREGRQPSGGTGATFGST